MYIYVRVFVSSLSDDRTVADAAAMWQDRQKLQGLEAAARTGGFIWKYGTCICFKNQIHILDYFDELINDG